MQSFPMILLHPWMPQRGPLIYKNTSASPLHWNLTAKEIDFSSPHSCTKYLIPGSLLVLRDAVDWLPAVFLPPTSISQLPSCTCSPTLCHGKVSTHFCFGLRAMLAQKMPLPLSLANEKRTAVGLRGKECIQLRPAVQTEKHGQWGWSHRAQNTLNLEAKLNPPASHSCTKSNFIAAENITHHIQLMLLI